MTQHIKIDMVDPEQSEELNNLIQTEELVDFVAALDEKIDVAESMKKDCLVPILHSIKNDIKKSINLFKADHIDFHEAYEEVVSLYVFTEMYFKLQQA